MPLLLLFIQCYFFYVDTVQQTKIKAGSKPVVVNPPHPQTLEHIRQVTETWWIHVFWLHSAVTKICVHNWCIFLVCKVFTLFYSLCSARQLSGSNLTQSFTSSRSQVFGNQIEDPFSMVSDNILYIILMMICPFGVIIVLPFSFILSGRTAPAASREFHWSTTD